MERYAVLTFAQQNGSVLGCDTCKTLEYARVMAENYASWGTNALIVKGEFFAAKSEDGRCKKCGRDLRECSCEEEQDVE